jgi:hypothetical protein
MVELGRVEKAKKKTNYFAKIKNFLLVAAIFVILYLLLWAKGISDKDKDYAWIFIIVMGCIAAFFYLLMKKSKVWSPYEAIKKIENTTGYSRLDTSWGAWECVQSNRNPDEALIYFKKSDPPFTFIVNMIDDGIRGIVVMTPWKYNELAGDNKRLDAYFSERQRNLVVEKLDREEGIISEDESNDSENEEG